MKINQNDKTQVERNAELELGATILIVDDIPANLNLLSGILAPEGYEILGATSGERALRSAARALPDLILLDIVMPGIDGFETCRRLKANPKTANIPVIFITVKDEVEDIVTGFQVGGVDYLTKSYRKEELLARVKTHLKIAQLTKALSQRNAELTQEIAKREQEEKARQQAEDALLKADEQLSLISEQEASRWGIKGFVGQSKTIASILDNVRKLQNTGTTSVLITGESGTGKELIARAIHFGGTRAKGPFIPVNCSAIPSALAESLLFGHVKGAFTGANTNKKGYFEVADGGTLFLDEIGEMPLELQPKLLRVLDNGVVIPMGATDGKQVDVRVLAATNVNLQRRVAEGKFREDLYYRLAGFPVIVPPLRERQEDIPLLVNHFLSMFATEMVIKQPEINPEALSVLKFYHFPGNVRELKNIIEGALIRSSSETIQPEHLHFIDVTNQPTANTRNLLSEDLSVEAAADIQTPETFVTRPVQSRDVENSESFRQPISFPKTDEEKIFEYVKQHNSISNAQCRDLLNVDIHRASYLLRKMYREGLLTRQGGHRGARYSLPQNS
ncbi:sigma-54-dependent Fis family transcriptional regulator [bacterium]|nr:sigma-54-dependent Fis family transcriptional regulator [bacterium]